MRQMQLSWFTKGDSFPFFIQYGGHVEDMFLHSHVDFSELVIVLQGNATHIVNAESSFIKKGDVFVIDGATSHGYKEPHDFRICNIMYSPELLRSAGSDLRASTGFQVLFVLEPFYRNIRNLDSKLSLPIPGLEYVSSIIADMIEEYRHKLPGYQTMLRSRFMELAVFLSRQYESQEQDGVHSNLMHLAAAISYIEDHYLEPLSREEIAARSNISERHLNRIFQAYYQTPPFAYLQRLRLEHASTLLKSTNYSITDIAYKSGFNDSNYFTRLFTRAYGIPPKGWRQKQE